MARGSTVRRLDLELVERGLAGSRERAQGLIAAGMVAVDGTPARSAAQPVAATTPLALAGREHPWAGRGGIKLAHALDAFGVSVHGRVCLDAGASTGGFTDVLLQRGAATVHAVDVGHGQLDGRLASDPRVRVLDRTNLRTLEPGRLSGPPPTLITLDLSFISLRLVMPAILRAGGRPLDVVALFKPQFELGRGAVGHGGVVRDVDAGRLGAEHFLEWAAHDLGATARGPEASPVTGRRGNREWLVHLAWQAAGARP